MKWRIALVVSLILGTSAGARAQEGTLPPDPEPQAEAPPEASVEVERPLRQGFLAGASFGLGSVKLSCDAGPGCGHYAGVGFSIDGGWAFAPRWAVVGELWFTGGVANADSDFAGQLWTFSANVRYWVFERFWLQGGLGFTGFDQLQNGKSSPVVSAGGGGLLLGAGVELWRSGNGHVVLDLRAKLGLMSVSDSGLADGSNDKVSTRQTTAMVTLSWY